MMAKENKVNLNDYLRILHKRKWLILSCLVGVLVSVTIFNEITSPIYEADTLIVFDNTNTAAQFSLPFSSPVNKSFLTNQIEEIKSRSLSFEVYDALPDSIINSFPLPRRREENFNLKRYVSRQIRERVSAITVANSEVIHIRIEAFSPAAAQIIANTITTVLQNRNLSVRRESASNVKQMIEDQLIVYKAALDSSEKALRAYKEKSKVTLVDREAEEILRRITEAEVSHNLIQAQLHAAEQRLTFIQSRLSQEREEIVPSIIQITSPLAKALKEELIDLEVQATMLRVQNYSDDHPKLRELERQIEQAKTSLKNETLKIAHGEDVIDPLSQISKYREEVLTIEIDIETYNAQEVALNKVIQQYENNLQSIPEKELHLAQLLRNLNVNEKIYTMLLSKREEAKILEAEQQGDIRIIDSAQRQQKPIKPKKILNLFLGFLLALMLCFGLVFLLEFFDATVNSVEEAERLTHLNVIGSIPRLDPNIKQPTRKYAQQHLAKSNGKYSSALVMHYLPQSIEAEAFRALHTNLQFSLLDLTSKVVLVTSSHPAEGKSTIVSNLSIATAHMGYKTLLIDSDLRKPVQHELFKIVNEMGLIDVIQNPYFNVYHPGPKGEKVLFENAAPLTANFDERQDRGERDVEAKLAAIHTVIKETGIANLDIITCGRRTSNPSGLLNSYAVEAILNTIRSQYDVIFLDTPPINVVVDASIVSRHVNCAILVIRVGKSNERDIIRAKSMLEQTKVASILLVLNEVLGQNGYSKYYYST